MKLIALNLPRHLTEDDLAKMFKAFGNIRGCTLVMDEKTGGSKGFGFVEMAEARDGEEAIAKLNGFVIDKQKIRVKAADR